MSESKEKAAAAVLEGGESSLEVSEKKKVKKKKVHKERKRPTQEDYSSARGGRRESGDGLVEKKSIGASLAMTSPRRGSGLIKKASEERFSADRFKSPQCSEDRLNTTSKDLWSLALIEKDKKKQESSTTVGEFKEESDVTNIFFIGGKNSGKTTIILGFLNRDEPPKPTAALEYTFGRKSRGANMMKDICHIWELGGGTSLSKMVQIPITLENIECISVMLVVDLSKPEELWVTLEVFLKEVRTHLRNLLSRLMSQSPEVANSLLKASWTPYGDGHPDKELLDPCPIPLTIIGTKYDIYQNFDPEKKKVISKTLRFVAHTNGASLQFFSHKSDSLMTKTRQLLGNYAFGTQLSPTMSMDYTKPLLVPVGSDALGQIGIPSLSTGELGSINARNPLELWKQAFCGFFPQVSVQSELGADPCKEIKYKETAVDAMRMQKDEELERYRRSCELRARDMAAGKEGHAAIRT